MGIRSVRLLRRELPSRAGIKRKTRKPHELGERPIPTALAALEHEDETGEACLRVHVDG